MKLQVFLYTKYGYAQAIADQLSDMFKCKCDHIPPAYQCNKEKLIFIVYEKYGKLDKKLVSYLKEMDTNKVLNVSLIEISNTGNEGVEELSAMLKANKVNISGVHNISVKRSLFSKGQLTEEDMAGAKAFADQQGKANFDFLNR